ncbi:hypothetical protein FTW19_11345 [Terriglobus albidus]|uniref:Uncharacterized protein n=1 Tax=Terriglobus albidus TaxID=1592106 RepID=A0A5B9E8V0_9BACT|nr:hypothetical protein [Terriglobus albidus]QEE28538.1 hypothetical protein FTW19_11345 [Terriglobus albidus]
MRVFALGCVVLVATLCCSGQQKITAAGVLTANGVPDSLILPGERSLLLTSVSTETFGPNRYIAWLPIDSGDAIGGPLTVVRYNTTDHHIERRVYKDGDGVRDARYKGMPAGREVSGMCFENDLGDWREQGGWLTLGFHVNPSEGCAFIFDDKFNFRFEIDGWIWTAVGRSLIVVENLRHFAPTHPNALDVFSPVTGKLEPIYPRPDDPVRSAYQKRLKPVMATPQECAAKNLSCDLHSIDADIDDITVISPTSFRFDITLSATGMGGTAEKEVPSLTTRYLATSIGGSWKVKPIRLPRGHD